MDKSPLDKDLTVVIIYMSTEINSLKSYVLNYQTQMNTSQKERFSRKK